MSADLTAHLAELARAATPGRAAKILALGGGMAYEALLEIGDIRLGGRSLQMPKVDALFHAAANPAVVLALLDVCAAAERTSSAIHVPTRKDDLAGLADLREALARLDAVVGHGKT